MPESVQKKLQRVRPPRVQITYEVETGNAIQLKELPFVMGVLGDFTGMPADPDSMEPFKERRFVEVTPDNFDGVLAKMKPHVAFAVKNVLSSEKDGPQLKVDLNFEKLEDFEPEQVARNIEPLKKLLELRTNLNNLRGKLQTNEKLDKALMDAISNTENLNKLRSEMDETKKEGESNG